MEARWKNGAAAKPFPMTGACRLGEYNVDIRRPDGFDSLETEQQLAKVRRSPETLEAGSGWKFLGEIAAALIGLTVQGYAQGYAIEQNRKTTPQHNRHGKTNIRCTSTNIGNTVSTNCR